MRFRHLIFAVLAVSCTKDIPIQIELAEALPPAYSEEVDSSFREIIIEPYTSLPPRKYYVINAESFYQLSGKKYVLTMSDSSVITLYTGYEVTAGNDYDAFKGTDPGLYTGFVAQMLFEDKFSNQNYDFRDKPNGLRSDPSLYKDKFVILNFLDVSIGWPGYGSSYGSINGRVALLPLK